MFTLHSLQVKQVKGKSEQHIKIWWNLILSSFIACVFLRDLLQTNETGQKISKHISKQN